MSGDWTDQLLYFHKSNGPAAEKTVHVSGEVIYKNLKEHLFCLAGCDILE